MNIMTNAFLLGVILAILIILVVECGRATPSYPVDPKTTDAFLDYRPGGYASACPSHYKCGAASLDQVQLENSLHTRLRESEKYYDAANPTDDQYHVTPMKAEPVACRMTRAANTKEGKYPEDGMITPHSDIEKRMMDVNTSRAAQSSTLMKAAPMPDE